MKYRKTISLMIILSILFLLPGCSNLSRKNIKIGLISSSDETDILTAINIDGINLAVSDCGFNKNNLNIVKNVNEESSFDTISRLTESGCKMIFGVGIELEDYFVQAATENPDTHYCVLNGKQATNGLQNYHTYSFPEYQTRYISGLAAGLKLNDMLKNGELSEKEMQLGYIAEYPDAEAISAYSAFYLGAKSVCDNVTLKVQYTFSKPDKTLNDKAALALIANGCKIISQQSYKYRTEEICSGNGIGFVGYLSDGEIRHTENYLCDGLIDMSSCYKYALDAVTGREDLPAQWSSSIYHEDSGFITELNENLFTSKERYDKAVIKISETEKQLKNGSLKVFDIQNWTVNGEIIDTTKKEEYEEIYGFTEYINDSYFMENEITSNPRFEFKIDGITELNLMDDYSL